MLDRFTIDDLKKSMKFLNISLSEDRLSVIADFLNQNIEAMRPLTQSVIIK